MINSKKKNWRLIVLLMFIFFAGVAVISTIQNTDKVIETPEDVIIKEASVTSGQATDILGALNGIGIEKIDSIKHDELLDNANADGEKGYRITYGELENIILYLSSDGSVNMIRWADNDLYANGKVTAKLSDFLITTKEMSDLQYKSQEAVKSLLKAPATANFPNINDWSFGKKDGVITVQSYVDAENSFGANIRSEFQFKIKNNQVISLIFDGKEYMTGN